MGGASGSRQDSSSSTNVPRWQRRHLQDLYGRAQGVSQVPLEYYPGETVAGFDPATLEAQDMALSRAREGNPALNAAQDYTTASIQGQYLDPNSNPYLRQTYDQAAEAVGDQFNRITLPGIESRFARAGQSNSGQLLGARRIATEALGDTLGGLATSIYGGAYDAERGRQDAASRFAPTLAAEDYRNIDAIGGVGAQREDQQQRLLDDLIARFDFAQNEPGLRLSRYAQLLGNPITLSQSSSRGRQFGFNISPLPTGGG